jgi:CubicO group peptidase (beta-lactamase class C family)
LESSIDEDGDILAPSGSLKSSVNEMALYLSTQLNDGVAPNQTRIISAENLKITHNPILENYAMGWETESYKNISVLMHTGAYDGFASVLVMIPSYNIGLVLLANSEEAAESLTENAHQILIDVLIEHLPDN